MWVIEVAAREARMSRRRSRFGELYKENKQTYYLFTEYNSFNYITLCKYVRTMLSIRCLIH